MKRLIPVLLLGTTCIAALGAAEVAPVAPTPEKPVENPKPKLKFTPESGVRRAPDRDTTTPTPSAPDATQLREMQKRAVERLRQALGGDPALKDMDRMFDAFEEFPDARSFAGDPFAGAEARMRDIRRRMEEMQADALRRLQSTQADEKNHGDPGGSGWTTETRKLPDGSTMTVRRFTFRSGTGIPAPGDKPAATAPAKPAAGGETPDDGNTVVLPDPPRPRGDEI